MIFYVDSFPLVFYSHLLIIKYLNTLIFFKHFIIVLVSKNLFSIIIFSFFTALYSTFFVLLVSDDVKDEMSDDKNMLYHIIVTRYFICHVINRYKISEIEIKTKNIILKR